MRAIRFSVFGLRHLLRPQLAPQIIKLAKVGLLTTAFCGYKMAQVYAASYQSTVISDNHPHCAVLVLSVSEFKDLASTLQVLKSIPKFVQPKSSEDEGIFSFSIFLRIGSSHGRCRFFDEILGKAYYVARNGSQGGMPLGEGNVIIHIKAQSYTLAYETVQEILKALPEHAYKVVSERYGWKYKDGRDLSGFLDGTMNPSVQTQRENAALDEQGGSYLIHQVWHHRLDQWNNVPTATQEKYVGRSKEKSVEMRPLPKSSHVARTRSENGDRLLIVRQSMPFGTVTGDHGLLFLAYAKNVDNFNIMLDRMVGKPDGVTDDIMKLSTNTFGNYFYVPSLQDLQKLIVN